MARGRALSGVFGEMLEPLLKTVKNSGRRGTPTPHFSHAPTPPAPRPRPPHPPGHPAFSPPGAVAPRTPNPRSSISQADFDRVRMTAKPHRPPPSTYLRQADIDAHLRPFRESGAIRFTPRDSLNRHGTLGPPGGTYAIPRSEFDAVMRRTNGDLGKVETELGLDPGTLTSGDTVVAYIDPQDLQNPRMPDGNELGANQHWEPGGYTSGGVPEATIDTPANTPYTEIHLSGRPTP